MFKNIIICFLLLILVSCNGEKQENYQISYDQDDSSQKTVDNTLELIFETDFNNDLLKININNSINEYYLKTDRSTGYADYYGLNKEMIFKRMSFSINNGKVIFIDERKSKYNFIYVNYIKDSVVNIQFSNKAKVYR